MADPEGIFYLCSDCVVRGDEGPHGGDMSQKSVRQIKKRLDTFASKCLIHNA